MTSADNPSSRPRHPVALALAALLAAAFALSVSGGAAAQDLDSRLDQKQAELSEQKDRKTVLSSELDRYNDRVDQLAGEVAVLRNREAIVAAQLRRVQNRLRAERQQLELLHRQLRRSLNVLRNRLVQIYRSGSPDVLTVILESDGFDDLVSRYEYLRRIEEQDANIVGRVRTLRNGTRETVERIEADRDEIAARKAELERTRVALEEREAELAAARDQKAAALETVESTIHKIEGDVSALQDQIQARLQAAQTAPASEPALPAGPTQAPSASGFIWPVEGALTSPFGMRWGRLHAGIDIGAPGGTPIQAAADGTIVLAEPYGGYGNYTCVDHGDGLSTCYAHQSAFELTSGSVSQGDVIGYVGNTGASFGDHLHFEVRVGGNPVDPLGYL